MWEPARAAAGSTCCPAYRDTSPLPQHRGKTAAMMAHIHKGSIHETAKLHRQNKQDMPVDIPCMIGTAPHNDSGLHLPSPYRWRSGSPMTMRDALSPLVDGKRVDTDSSCSPSRPIKKSFVPVPPLCPRPGAETPFVRCRPTVKLVRPGEAIRDLLSPTPSLIACDVSSDDAGNAASAHQACSQCTCAQWKLQCKELQRQNERLKGRIGEQSIKIKHHVAVIARLQRERDFLSFISECVQGVHTSTTAKSLAEAASTTAKSLAEAVVNGRRRLGFQKRESEREFKKEVGQEEALKEQLDTLMQDQSALEEQAGVSPDGRIAQEISRKKVEIHQVLQQRQELQSQHKRERAERDTSAAQLRLQVAFLEAEKAQQELEALVQEDHDGKAEIDNPVMWGITMQQLLGFQNEVEDVLEDYCARHQYFRQRGPDGHVHVHVCTAHNCPDNHYGQDFKHVSDVPHGAGVGPLKSNMHLVVAREVKPRTLDSNCSMALSWNPRGLKANIYVSHSWNELFREFTHTLRNALDFDQDVMWVCSFALNQHRDIASMLDVELMESPFAVALRQTSKMVVALESKLDAPNRAWCTFEMALARHWGKPTALWFYKVAAPDLTSLKDKVETFDYRAAEASSEHDRRRIRDAIRNLSDGRDDFNVAIRGLLMDRLKLHESIAAEHQEAIADLESQLEMSQGDSESTAKLRCQIETLRQALARQSAASQEGLTEEELTDEEQQEADEDEEEKKEEEGVENINILQTIQGDWVDLDGVFYAGCRIRFNASVEEGWCPVDLPEELKRDSVFSWEVQESMIHLTELDPGGQERVSFTLRVGTGDEGLFVQHLPTALKWQLVRLADRPDPFPQVEGVCRRRLRGSLHSQRRLLWNKETEIFEIHNRMLELIALLMTE